MTLPTTKKLLRSFLGLISFYKVFIPQASELTGPLSDLLKKLVRDPLQWTEDLHERLKLLKQALTSGPILHLPDPSLLQPQAGNLTAIASMTPPTTKKLLRSFLGFISFYKVLIPQASELTGPLSDMLKKLVRDSLQWTEDLQTVEAAEASLDFRTYSSSSGPQPDLRSAYRCFKLWIKCCTLSVP